MLGEHTRGGILFILGNGWSSKRGFRILDFSGGEELEQLSRARKQAGMYLLRLMLVFFHRWYESHMRRIHRRVDQEQGHIGTTRRTRKEHRNDLILNYYRINLLNTDKYLCGCSTDYHQGPSMVQL